MIITHVLMQTQTGKPFIPSITTWRKCYSVYLLLVLIQHTNSAKIYTGMVIDFSGYKKNTLISRREEAETKNQRNFNNVKHYATFNNMQFLFLVTLQLLEYN